MVDFLFQLTFGAAVIACFSSGNVVAYIVGAALAVGGIVLWNFAAKDTMSVHLVEAPAEARDDRTSI